MRNKHLLSGESAPPPASGRAKGGALSRLAQLWLADGESAGWSPRTLSARRDMLAKFSWWLEAQGCPQDVADVSSDEIRLFLTYLRRGLAGGRWETNSKNTTRAARPSTVDTYFRCLRAFFNFLRREGRLSENPAGCVTPPRVPKDQVQPFTKEQVEKLLKAAKGSNLPERDQALLLVLIDTGLRVSELCSLTVGAVDPDAKALVVAGKGGKKRVAYLSAPVRRAVWRYLERQRPGAADDEALFTSGRGRRPEAALTPSGVCQLFHRLGRVAGLRDEIRCSPHTARHYFAVTMLRNGANLFELQQLMGHEDLTMLRRYVALAEADLAAVHRRSSPASRLRL